jgi:hypothetical protein
MSIFDIFKGPTPEQVAAQRASEKRQADILMSLRQSRVPTGVQHRLRQTAEGKMPWVATLTPAELMVARSHGLRPIAAVSATCWLHYGFSWTRGHAEGWHTALQRLQAEAKACGANAVLDVKMRTIPLDVESSMDFTLVGTAVRVEGLPPSDMPVVATVPALEFVKLLEADVVPTGIAVGAHYQWMTDWRGTANMSWMGNTESYDLTNLWQTVRYQAHADLRNNVGNQGNGVLAHLNFSQMFERETERGEAKMKEYLARHIVVATIVDARRGQPFNHEIKMVVDMCAGKTPLTGTERHHQSYATNEKNGAI